MDKSQVALIKRILLIAFVAGVIAVLIYLGRDSPDIWPATSAAALGTLVAIAELVTRYRDDPASALISVPAIIYVSINAAAALGALFLIQSFGWTFGAADENVVLVQTLTAGFGSAALFRSSLFNVTAGDQVIGIGPSAVLNVILTAADRAVDRQRAILRSEQAGKIMSAVSFERSADSLVAFTAATMQNLTAEEAQAIKNRVALLRDRQNDDIPDVIKSYILGMSLLTFTGRKVLDSAVEQIRDAFPKAQASSVAIEGLESASVAAVVPKPLEVTVLERLADSGNTLSIQELQRQLGIDYRSMTRGLRNLADRDLIIVEGQIVKLKT